MKTQAANAVSPLLDLDLSIMKKNKEILTSAQLVFYRGVASKRVWGKKGVSFWKCGPLYQKKKE